MQWAIAPCIALCSSSMDEVMEEETLGKSEKDPELARPTPERFGDDLMEDGQLTTQLLLCTRATLGYLCFRFPEKED